MNLNTDQSKASRFAERYTRERAELYLVRWAHEMAGGEGKSNMLARLLEAPGGSGEGSRPPGGSFTPVAEKVDQILKDARVFDGLLYRVLLCRAFGQTVDDIARNEHIGRSKAYTMLEHALGALRFQLYLRRV